MRKMIAWAGRILLGSAFILCLAFWAQQALGFAAPEHLDWRFECDQYCPEEPKMCDECCTRYPPAQGGQCSGNTCNCYL
jgi:hypothetical protein